MSDMPTAPDELSGWQIGGGAAGLGGSGLLLYLLHKAGEREKERAATAAKALDEKDKTIKEFAERSMGLVDRMVERTDSRSDEHEKRISQIEGKMNMKERDA